MEVYPNAHQKHFQGLEVWLKAHLAPGRCLNVWLKVHLVSRQGLNVWLKLHQRLEEGLNVWLRVHRSVGRGLEVWLRVIYSLARDPIHIYVDLYGSDPYASIAINHRTDPLLPSVDEHLPQRRRKYHNPYTTILSTLDTKL